MCFIFSHLETFFATFNGAGVFRPRKYGADVQDRGGGAPSMGPGSFDPGNWIELRDGGHDDLPSMGPGSFDPGNGQRLDCGYGTGCPSMGPGSFDPGNSVAAIAVIYRIQYLQWGRGLSTPEMRISWTPARDQDSPSMGPGSFDPGNRSQSLRSDFERPPSMGPGSFDPGNSLPANFGDARTRPSMGPGSFDPGNPP